MQSPSIVQGTCRLVIFGSRPKYIPRSMNLNRQVELIRSAVLKFGLIPTEVVTGCAQGIDTAAIVYARSVSVPVKAFRPDWDAEPRAAGFIRNKQMAMYADVGLGFQWQGSSGTQHMIDTMHTLKKLTYVVYDGELDYAF